MGEMGFEIRLLLLLFSLLVSCLFAVIFNMFIAAFQWIGRQAKVRGLLRWPPIVWLIFAVLSYHCLFAFIPDWFTKALYGAILWLVIAGVLAAIRLLRRQCGR